MLTEAQIHGYFTYKVALWRGAVLIPNVTPLPPSTQVDEYRIERTIGQGGFGTTYLALDTTLCKKFALKEYTPHHLVFRHERNCLQVRDPALHDVFERGLAEYLVEARRLAKFSHPNIVRVSRFFQDNGTAYLLTDFEEGGSLRELLRSHEEVWTEDEIRSLLLPICAGIETMHEKGLIHGDIKPDNIVIRLSGDPVLIDLGASMEYGSHSNDRTEVVATPAYAPPEWLFRKSQRGPWVDLYSVAATMYELMSGKPPIWIRRGHQFDPGIPVSASAVVADEIIVKPVADVARNHYSTQLMMVIDRCLEADYTARPHSISEFIRALSFPEDLDISDAVSDISWKMLQHFSNWAKPNDGLFVEEFAMFIACFPAIDFSWRLSDPSPKEKTFDRIAAEIDLTKLSDDHKETLVERGFCSLRSEGKRVSLEARVNEYVAAYRLDRRETNWTYSLLLEHVVQNCLASTAQEDINGFSELMEGVIDRARGRVKKVVRKAFTPYYWTMTHSGWARQVKDRVE